MPIDAGGDTPIRVTVDTKAFDEAMEEISASAEHFGQVFSFSMRNAVLAGRDLDDSLRSIALRISSMALDQALAPLDQLVGSLFSGLLGGAKTPEKDVARGSAGASTVANVIFNMQSPDAAGFTKSEPQIAALMGRALARAQRTR